MFRLEKIWNWLNQRLQIGGIIEEGATHQVPRKTASWWYVFGSAALTVFMLQVFTGIMLALIYVPSAAESWNSLQYLNHAVTLGWFLRAWRVQVSTRADLAPWRLPTINDSCHGVYRASHAL